MWAPPLVDKQGIHGKDVSGHWSPYANATTYLRFEEDYWKELTVQLKDAGCTSIILDVGDGICFESHPEIASEGAWSKQKFADELARLRGMGFEVIPKLNFSAGHDLWLGEYERMLSTSIYYKVTADLITETAELFDHPRFFHLGMDEETARNQVDYNYMVVRQGELWWHDFYKLVKATEAAGCRPWIWSDYAWDYEEEFFKNMPKEVLQSNWYYDVVPAEKAEQEHMLALFDKLEAAGFDQVPTGSNWARPDNFSTLVDHCKDRISNEHLVGFMQTPWMPTLRELAKKHDGAISDMTKAMELYR
jgi:hypothetical protein